MPSNPLHPCTWNNCVPCQSCVVHSICDIGGQPFDNLERVKGVVNHVSTIQPFQIHVQYGRGPLHLCTSISIPTIPIPFAQHVTFGDPPFESFERMKSGVVTIQSPFNLSRMCIRFPKSTYKQLWRTKWTLMIWRFPVSPRKLALRQLYWGAKECQRCRVGATPFPSWTDLLITCPHLLVWTVIKQLLPPWTTMEHLLLVWTTFRSNLTTESH